MLLAAAAYHPNNWRPILAALEVDPPGDVGDAWADNAAPVADTAHLLINRRIGALPALKGEKVVGIITETDMIRALFDLEESQGMQ